MTHQPGTRERLGCRLVCVRVALACALLTGLTGGACDRREPVSADAPVVRLELWTLALRPHFTDYMNGLVEGFEQANPGIDVVWVDVPFDAVQRKFIAAAAAGRSPDVVNLSDQFFARFTALGGLADLSDRLPGDPKAVYLPGALRLCELDGGLYGLPWYLATPIMFCNAGLLAEGGLSSEALADDWPGFAAQARAYHERTGKFLFCPLLGQETELPLWLVEAGLPLFVAHPSGEGLKANLTDPSIVAFVGQWVDAYRAGAFPRAAATQGHAGKIDLFQNGQVATLITSAGFMQRIRDASPTVYAQTTIRPPPTFAPGRHPIETMVLAVSSRSSHPREAAALAWHLTSHESQLEFCRIVNILPSTRRTLDDPLFAAPPPDEAGTDAGRLAAARHLAAEQMRHATSFVPALSTWPQLRDAFGERIKLALLDGKDVSATLAEIEREWQAILDSAAPASLAAVPKAGR